MVGVEPEAGDDTRRSLAAGERVRIPVPRTIADGGQLPIPGELTFEVVKRHVAEVAVASDPEIVAAMRFLFERLKTVAEPSGACALAALLAGRVDAQGLRVGVTISGGNVAPERFSGAAGGVGSADGLERVIAGGRLRGPLRRPPLEKRRCRRRARITLVNDVNFMLYTPLLPGAAGGTLEPRHVVVPLREELESADLKLGRVTGADPARRQVDVRSPEGDDGDSPTTS